MADAPKVTLRDPDVTPHAERVEATLTVTRVPVDIIRKTLLQREAQVMALTFLSSH